jgi:long-chain acyl-CoA synthetase
MSPLDALFRQIDAPPGRLAFTYGDAAWTYRDLLAEAERLAQALLARGIRQGDRVALHMANSPEMVITYCACFRIGAIAAPMNLRFKTAELRHIFQRMQPALYLGGAQLYSQVESIEPEILPPDVRFTMGPTPGCRGARPWAQLFEVHVDRSIPSQPDMDAPAVLLTTSGTTGQPKFVVHTATTLSAIADAYTYLGFDREQIAVNALPMVHASGVMTLLACFHHGIPMVLLERFDPDAVLDAIAAHRCTWMLGLPFMFDAMIERQRLQPRSVDSLQLCLAGGDVCPPALQQHFLPVFGVSLRSVWAATEVGPLAYGLQPGSVSRIVPGTQVRLVDDHGMAVKRGEVGELLLRGPNVTAGYWVGPNRIDDARSDGWFHTGDLMRQGKGDELWFAGRCKDLIIRAGSNIAPAEVEGVLVAHPRVHGAAVVGLPDPVLGQRVAGIVQLEPGSPIGALDDILVDVKTKLADYKMPEWLSAVDEIPRNPLGKIDRDMAAAMLTERRSGDSARRA